MKTKINKTYVVLLILGLFTSFGFTNAGTSVTKPKIDETVAITADDIIEYLENCSHHHWACCATPIPGTSNWTAIIENCGTATVVVNNGIIIVHSDARGICGE